MVFGLPAIGETSWGQKILDSINAVKVTADAALPSATAAARHAEVTVVTGAGVDPTGVSDSAAAIQALVDAAPQGASIVFPRGLYKLGSSLTITKTLRFGGETATRSNIDLSNPAAGVEFVYTGTSGDAITVRPPLPDGSGDNGRISPVLHDFHVRGNKDVVGATGGGGITLDGRSVAACAISGFVVENVNVSEAKGDGFTVTGDVYEGRIVGLSSFRNAGKGVNVGAVNQPGEIAWDDIHTNDNTSDGAYLAGAGTHSIGRWTASRNGGRGFHAKGVQLVALDLHCESNAGSEVVTLEDVVKAVLLGLNVDYAEPSYVGTGLAVTGASSNVVVIASEFSGSSTTWDITTAATSSNTVILNYRQSATDKVSFAGADDLLMNGAVVRKGTMEVASDATDRTPFRLRGFAGQTQDMWHILNSAGGVLARVTASGSFRSGDDMIARLGAGSMTQIGEMGPGGEAGLHLGADCSIYRRAADVIRTDDKFLANAGLGVGNSVAAATPGAVVRKMEVFDATGASLGFVPIYDAIT